jgi:EamA domain-containing membrane protein RarD
VDVPDYTALGVSGLIAATLAYILWKVWAAYQGALREIAEQNRATTRFLTELSAALTALKLAIEGQERTFRLMLSEALRERDR